MTTVQKKPLVQVISRTQFEDDPRKVVYRVRSSSDPTKEYETFLFDGKATSCTCPSRLPCFHEEQLEEREATYAERDRIMAEFVLSEAQRHTAVIAASDDSSSGSDSSNDPWFGLTSAERFQAWRNYEAAMAGLA
jgi:hypothetical protein